MFQPTDQISPKKPAAMPKPDRLEFEPVKIRLTGHFRDSGETGNIEIEAMEGRGTGLAYHPVVVPESGSTTESDGSGGIIVTYLQSGKCLGHLTVETPRQARHWIELLAMLADWTQPPGQLVAQRADFARLELAVEEARRTAIDRSIFVEFS